MPRLLEMFSFETHMDSTPMTKESLCRIQLLAIEVCRVGLNRFNGASAVFVKTFMCRISQLQHFTGWLFAR